MLTVSLILDLGSRLHLEFESALQENGIFESKSLVRQAIFDYLETFYNRARLHSTFGYLSPDGYVARHHQNPKLN